MQNDVFVLESDIEIQLLYGGLGEKSGKYPALSKILENICKIH